MRDQRFDEMIAETRQRYGEHAAADEEELFEAFADLVPGDRLQRMFHETFVDECSSH